MRPNTLGRALGIGLRLTREKLLPTPTPAQRRAASEQRVQAGHTLGRKTRHLQQGGKHFGRAVWNPFAHASSILWLEITGMFFALFAFLFAQHVYTLRANWRSGPEHAHFLIYALFSLLFLYFAGSSFVRARARNRRRRRERR